MKNFGLWIDNLFLVLRSRKGFFLMLAFFRLFGGIGILITLIYPLPFVIDFPLKVAFYYIHLFQLY